MKKEEHKHQTGVSARDGSGEDHLDIPSEQSYVHATFCLKDQSHTCISQISSHVLSDGNIRLLLLSSCRECKYFVTLTWML